jgi:alpha-beta hydrolase superfamily lysophospholipase
MTDPGGTPRWARVLTWLVVGLFLLLVVFYAGGGWYFSGLIDDRALDGASRRASTEPSYDLEVVRVGEGTIDLAAEDDPPDALVKDGVFGLRWEGGYGQVGAVLASGTPPDGAGAVQREFTMLEGAAPEPGDAAELDVRAYPADPGDAGLAFEGVFVPGPLGEYPAWFVGGASSTWAIVLHGNSMTRLDCVRILPILAAAGLPTLTVTYRNDAGAPEDPSGKLRYGLTEWEDLEAAVRYALDRGAEDVVLVGFSMGGGIAAAFLQRSELATDVRAVVMDAPMLDFSTTVDDNASRETLPLVGLPLPSSLTAVAKWMAGWRFGVDWGALDYLAGADDFEVPFLVLHGTEDTTIPIGTSETFASLRPDIVSLVRCRGAEHIECWNLDREAYARRVLRFLRQTVGSQG